MSQIFLLFCHRWSLIICSIHMKMCHCSANLHWLLLFKKKGKLFPRKVFSNPFVTHDNNPTVITDLSKSFCQFKKCVILSFVIFIGGKISKENLIFFSNVLKMNEITVCQHFCLKNDTSLRSVFLFIRGAGKKMQILFEILLPSMRNVE